MSRSMSGDNTDTEDKITTFLADSQWCKVVIDSAATTATAL